MSVFFRENLRRELDYQNITVKELCAKTGISKATVECYLGARATMPSADTAYRIASALGVTVEYLLTGTDSRPRMAHKRNSSKFRELCRVIQDFDGEQYEPLIVLAKLIQKTARLHERHGGMKDA